jgi:hypothetical protein
MNEVKLLSEKDKMHIDYENHSFMLGVYSFYDTEANTYDIPFYCNNDLFANRHYKTVMQKESSMKLFEEHYELHRLGYYNKKTSKFHEFKDVLIEGKIQKKLREAYDEQS